MGRARRSLTVPILLLMAAFFWSMAGAAAYAAEHSAVETIMLVPVRLGAALIGTPIAMIRRSYSDTREILKEYKNDNYSWKVWGGIVAPWVGLCQGTIEGCFYGPKHAFTAKEPFSKEAFSLEELN